MAQVVDQPVPGLVNTLALCALLAGALLMYLRLLTKAHSPALAEARLQALQARIRPHFLFNSLNAVLALIRSDPRRAERSLEDLADLFRALMSDARQFVRLADEISLLERYAAIEQLRLGDRLRMTWDLDGAPADALLPPLVLQPLLENAVYHGVEPGTGASRRAGAHRPSAASASSRRSRIPISRPKCSAPATTWRWRTSASACSCFSTPRRASRIKAADGRYRVEIEIPYKIRPT